MLSRVLGGAVDLIHRAMGNHYSQFLGALKRGDAIAALESYNNKKSVRESISPNEPLGAEHKDNTVLHYCARLNIQSLYGDLLREGGKPDLKNGSRKNCLHLICEGVSMDSTVKESMLRLTLEVGLNGMDVEHVLNERDHDGNTVLHVVARAGLSDCVDLLVTHKANLSATNTLKETPADLATKFGHTDIATKLETKILFHDDVPGCSVDPDPEVLEEIASGRMGMRDIELRSMKDELLIETSTMLGVSLFTAQVLLQNHDWSKETLLDAWMSDPADVCEKAGVDLPQDLGVHNLDGEVCVRSGGVEEGECGVCYLQTPLDVSVPCQHVFCTSCWKQYLEDKITSGETHTITCPEYACYRLVPLNVIERIVSGEMARRFLSYDIKAFVDSNPNIRWCPTPGCGQAVSLPPGEESQEITVHCGNDHYFCWTCMKGPHDPCSCEQWKKWLEHIIEMKPRVGDSTAAEADEAASSKWLADRSKPCPKCKSPIEKTEGCNHMCCKKCKHDFCWVCLDNWKCHNSSTGGYFECNRYDAQKKASELLSERRDTYYDDAREWEAISRFLHYYERYKEHLNSLSLEEPFLNKARDKMKQLASSIQQLECLANEPLDMSFIEDAVRELLRCRRVLQATYAFAYYLTGKRRKEGFERLQGSLEQATELLAEVVARPHLRKPRSEIIRLTREARTKRNELLGCKSKMEDSTPPLLSRQPLPRLQEEDDEEDSYSSFMRILRRIESMSHDQPHITHDAPRRSHDPPRRRSHDRSHDQQSEDNELLRALEISRQEFRADEKLKEDIERAKEESIQQEASILPCAPTTGNDWTVPVLDTIEDHPIDLSPHQTTPPQQDWLHRLDTHEDVSWPVLQLDPSDDDNGEPEQWGPLYGEDEDLERALAMSIQDDMMTIQGTQMVDSNKLAENDSFISLPPELRHLLVTKRAGKHV